MSKYGPTAVLKMSKYGHVLEIFTQRSFGPQNFNWVEFVIAPCRGTRKLRDDYALPVPRHNSVGQGHFRPPFCSSTRPATFALFFIIDLFLTLRSSDLMISVSVHEKTHPKVYYSSCPWHKSKILPS